MSCKPTVGEVRETATRTRIPVTHYHLDNWNVFFVGTVIVEVAPKNRVRVTAGPPSAR